MSFPIDFETFFNIESNKIRIIPLVDPAERKTVHQWIEQNYPEMSKTSLCLPALPMGQNVPIGKCYCGNRIRLEFKEVLLKNDIDQFYSGYCNKCGECFHVDAGYEEYDDDFFTVKPTNAIGIGNAFRKFSKLGSSGIPIEKSQILTILKDKVYYEMEASLPRKRGEMEMLINMQL